MKKALGRLVFPEWRANIYSRKQARGNTRVSSQNARVRRKSHVICQFGKLDEYSPVGIFPDESDEVSDIDKQQQECWGGGRFTRHVEQYAGDGGYQVPERVQ